MYKLILFKGKSFFFVNLKNYSNKEVLIVMKKYLNSPRVSKQFNGLGLRNYFYLFF